MAVIQRTKTRSYYYASYDTFTLHSRPVLLSVSKTASYDELCAKFLESTKCVPF